MQNTAIIQLFGSFFLSIASQHQDKDLLLKHLANFKGALYSNQQTPLLTHQYLDRLQKQVASKVDKKGATLAAIKSFQKCNKVMYAHIRKVANRPQKYIEGEKADRARPGSTFEIDSRKYLNSSQYAQRNLRAKESSDPQLRYG